ncbi:hypothetical protein Acr_15g0010160 [Actinidia rufa]|uniref:Uncharacterized protein n=1 Tax=Actinidia rufa TaxID=165716 RepID=A0A7J0FWV7_9ERIC|nr:hypothetical protein Acr_15g0010160 [Actinidia rufa]
MDSQITFSHANVVSLHLSNAAYHSKLPRLAISSNSYFEASHTDEGQPSISSHANVVSLHSSNAADPSNSPQLAISGDSYFEASHMDERQTTTSSHANAVFLHSSNAAYPSNSSSLVMSKEVPLLWASVPLFLLGVEVIYTTMACMVVFDTDHSFQDQNSSLESQGDRRSASTAAAHRSWMMLFLKWKTKFAACKSVSSERILLGRAAQFQITCCSKVEHFIFLFIMHYKLEGLSLFVSMVEVTQWSNQPTNAKYVEEMWKVGVRANEDEKGNVRREELQSCSAELVLQIPSGEQMEYVIRISDSQLVVNQVQGDYLAQYLRMVAYLDEMKAISMKTKYFKIRQIPREENKKVESVILVEIGMPSLRTLNFDKKNNEVELRLNLDLLAKKMEQAKVRQAAYKHQVAMSYNQKVKHRPFLLGNLVLRKVTLSTKELNTGKLGPTWEGLYRVIKMTRIETYWLEDMKGRVLPHH